MKYQKKNKKKKKKKMKKKMKMKKKKKHKRSGGDCEQGHGEGLNGCGFVYRPC